MIPLLYYYGLTSIHVSQGTRSWIYNNLMIRLSLNNPATGSDSVKEGLK